jgi:hypothetical protein
MQPSGIRRIAANRAAVGSKALAKIAAVSEAWREDLATVDLSRSLLALKNAEQFAPSP